MSAPTREQWLLLATGQLSKIVSHEALVTVPPIYVSVGFPKGVRGRRRAIGQCWQGSLSVDGKPHVFICPTLSDPVQVLGVLLHELVHASGAHGHKGDFVKRAKACGLVKPWTATVVGPELAARLNDVAAKLGPYPHSALSLALDVKKGSRLRLWECGCEKPVKVRVASDDFDATCNVCSEPFTKQEERR